MVNHAAMLAEILEMTHHRVVRPGDITAMGYAEAAGVTDSTARNRLNKKVKTGELETAMAYNPASGRQVRVWWLADDN